MSYVGKHRKVEPPPVRHFLICTHCGRPDVHSHDAGYGSVYGSPVCRPTVDGRPDCYRLVTAFSHPMPCNHPECHDN